MFIDMSEPIDLEKFRKHFLRGFKTLSDSPNLENIQFNFSTYGKQLAHYITSESLPTPLTIGLNGAWGTGKTTMIKIIQKEIKSMNNRTTDELIRFGFVHTDFIDFNAWDAEKTDIALLLYKKIFEHKSQNDQCNKLKITEFNKSLVTLFADVALRKFGGITYNDAKEHFDKLIDSKTISKQVCNLIGDERLVVFIDDLDRCNASNILKLLETIKNILNIENLIFVITVDIKKIERAWELQYKMPVGVLEGQEHVEKLFQIVFSLPFKNDNEIEIYVDSLTHLDKLYNKLHIHLVKNLTDNPRKIKRMLNTIFFIIQNYDLENIELNDDNGIVQEYQLHFAFIITWVSLATNHRRILQILQRQPHAIIPIVLFFNELNLFSELQEHYTVIEKNDFNSISIFDKKQKNSEHVFYSELFDPTVRDILKIVVKDDKLAFKTLKQIGKFFKKLSIDLDDGRIHYSSNNLYKYYEGTFKTFKKIIENGGLVGV